MYSLLFWKAGLSAFFFFPRVGSLSCFAPGKENTCRRKQKELKADKEACVCAVGGG